VRALEDRCERPDGFELAAYWQEWSRDFEESLPRVEVKARGPKGERTLMFASLEEAHRELLRYGSDLEVLEPVELRERVAVTARQVASLYGL
jgi:predicted DNA-binding transcriptional regulator YafY